METNETEQLEKKFNFGNIVGKGLLGLAICGMGAVLSSGCYIFIREEPPKKPIIYQEYENAQTSLQNVRQVVVTGDEVLFPYKDIKLKQVIDENYSRLNEIIKSLERDIGKIEENHPEIEQYQQNSERFIDQNHKIVLAGQFGGLATIFGLCGYVILKGIEDGGPF